MFKGFRQDCSSFGEEIVPGKIAATHLSASFEARSCMEYSVVVNKDNCSWLKTDFDGILWIVHKFAECFVGLVKSYHSSHILVGWNRERSAIVGIESDLNNPALMDTDNRVVHGSTT